MSIRLAEIDLSAPDVERRFRAKVRYTDTCWIWQAHIDAGGYPRLLVDSSSRMAHRVAYLLFRGSIPDGLQLDHLCRIRHCVNPWHLEPVTQQENIRRGALGNAMTHCRHGHRWNEANIYIDRKGKRWCRPCMMRRQRDYRARGRVA